MDTQPQTGSTKPKSEIAQYMAARRANLIAAGLCCDCGLKPASKAPPLHAAKNKDQKHVLCDTCLEDRRSWQKARMEIRRARGKRWGAGC
jgi:hypothetical protein